MRTAACLIAALASALVCASPAHAQAYPVKAVRIIVPVAPGGGTDPQARLLGKKFQESMGQPFVDREPHRRRQHDRHGIRRESAAPTATRCCARPRRSPARRRCARIFRSTAEGLIPVGQISSDRAVPASCTPACRSRRCKEFIALAKKQGGKMNAASGGNGSANHLTLEMLKQRAGIQATHIPYKGSGPATIALMQRRSRFQFRRRAHLVAARSLRQDQGARGHHAQAVAARARRAAARDALSGIRSDQLVRDIRARRNARGDRQQGQREIAARSSFRTCANS